MMFCRGTGLMILTVAAVLLLGGSVDVHGQETSIKAGDKVVTKSIAVLLNVGKTSLIVEGDTDLVALNVENYSVEVAVERNSRKIKGWIFIGELYHMKSVSTAGFGWGLPTIEDDHEPRERIVPLFEPKPELFNRETTEALDISDSVKKWKQEYCRTYHGGGTTAQDFKIVKSVKSQSLYSIKRVDSRYMVSDILPDRSGRALLGTTGKVYVLRTLDIRNRVVSWPVLDGLVCTPRTKTIGTMDLATGRKLISDPGFDFAEYKKAKGVIPFANGYAVNLFRANVTNGRITQPGQLQTYVSDDGHKLPGRIIRRRLDRADGKAILDEVVLYGQRENKPPPLIADQSLDGLVAALKGESREVRLEAITKLCRMQGPEATEALVSALNDKNVDIGFVARNALVARQDPAAIAPLMSGLKRKELTFHLVAGLLVAVGEPSVQPSIAALRDEMPTVRECAARVLAGMKDARAVEPLIATLKDENARVREQAAWALREIKDARAVEPLIGTLNDEDPACREMAAVALGWIKDRRAAPRLIGVLQDDVSDVRAWAAWALGQLKDPRAEQSLRTALEDENENVRWEAERALEKIRLTTKESD